MCGCLKGRIRSRRVQSDGPERHPSARVHRYRAPVDAVAPPVDCRRHRTALPHSLGVADALCRRFTLIEPVTALRKTSVSQQ